MDETEHERRSETGQRKETLSLSFVLQCNLLSLFYFSGRADLVQGFAGLCGFIPQKTLSLSPFFIRNKASYSRAKFKERASVLSLLCGRGAGTGECLCGLFHCTNRIPDCRGRQKGKKSQYHGAVCAPVSVCRFSPQSLWCGKGIHVCGDGHVGVACHADLFAPDLPSGSGTACGVCSGGRRQKGLHERDGTSPSVCGGGPLPVTWFALPACFLPSPCRFFFFCTGCLA